MSDVVRRERAVLARLDGLSRVERREMAHQLDAARAEGIVAAARVEAASFVTQVAMRHLEIAQATEVQLVCRYPANAIRVQCLVDAFASLATGELQRLGARSWLS